MSGVTNGALSGKVALITGGASGLGAATARLFAAQGARLAILDIQQAEGSALAAEIGAIFVFCDVTSEEGNRAAIDEAVERLGALHVMHLNAGGSAGPEPLAQMSADKWDRSMALMPRAAMFAMKHGFPHLRAAGGGSIITTASIGGMRPGISDIAYSVAKAAVLQLVQQASVEFGPSDVRVNAISPGIIPTQGIGSFFGVPRDRVDAMLGEVARIFDGAQPIPHAGTGEDIAQMALFLASDNARWVTGQNFVVDGGMMQMGPGSLEPMRAGSVIQQVLALAQNYRG